MQRLFAAIEIPARIRDRLAQLRMPLPGARWIDPDDMHLTLRFLGDIDDLTAGECSSQLSQIDAEPFDLQIMGLGQFGNREPRAVWAGVAPNEALERLQRTTERAARSAGLPPETRNFRPHVTLARLRGSRPDAVARFLQSRGMVMTEPFRVTRFGLFSSKPGTGGGPYVLEEAYPLGAPWEQDEHD